MPTAQIEPSGLSRHRLDDVLRAAAVVGGLHDVPRHLGMHDDADAGMLPADGFDLLGGEPLVDRAVAFPQDHLRALHLVGIESAEDLVRIPHDHLVERDAHLVRRVAPKMLIGQEQNLLAVREAPLQRRHRVRRRADRAAALADERLNRRRRVDVGHRHDALDPHLRQLFPARLELLGLGHVGHRAAGGEVGQDDLLMRAHSTSALSAMKCTPQKTM